MWPFLRDTVGSNVRLLRKLGYVEEGVGLVYCWPDRMAKQEKPPRVLRLFGVRVGRCPMWLVSNVLAEDKLSEQEAIELYRRRWVVELQFRTLKQTFGRDKLRCCSPDRALVEMDGSLLGLWVIPLFAIKEQIEMGTVPDRCSVGVAIAIVRSMMDRWWESPDVSLAENLQGAVKD